jgi:CHAD domain-containing protein
MSFQLKANESVSDGIARCVRREIQKAIDHLGSKVPPTEREAWENEAVHEVRKGFKRVRAALRLVRETLGEEVYHEENFCFRDAARPLTLVRDGAMLVDTLDKLAQDCAVRVEPGALAKARDRLLAGRREVSSRVLGKDRAFATVTDVARRALGRMSDWRVECDGWAALEGGLRRVYRTGHRACATAAESPTMENLHEWRKQAKYLWHDLQLLEPAWTQHETGLGDQAHELSQLLGEDHDLAILRRTLAADPLTYGGHRFLKGLFVVVDGKRGELQRHAFELGRQVYRDAPKVFTSRMEGYWNAWTVPGESRAPPLASTPVARSLLSVPAASAGAAPGSGAAPPRAQAPIRLARHAPKRPGF